MYKITNSTIKFLSSLSYLHFIRFFFFNDTTTTEIYTLSLHDALPISCPCEGRSPRRWCPPALAGTRSEEHTSELQSHSDLVCRLLLEKKNTIVQHLLDLKLVDPTRPQHVIVLQSPPVTENVCRPHNLA